MKDNLQETRSVSEPSIVREPELHLDEMDNASDPRQVNAVGPTQTALNETEPMTNEDRECDTKTEQAARRPYRQRTKPKILTYPKLGNTCQCSPISVPKFK